MQAADRSKSSPLCSWAAQRLLHQLFLLESWGKAFQTLASFHVPRMWNLRLPPWSPEGSDPRRKVWIPRNLLPNPGPFLFLLHPLCNQPLCLTPASVFVLTTKPHEPEGSFPLFHLILYRIDKVAEIWLTNRERN